MIRRDRRTLSIGIGVLAVVACSAVALALRMNGDSGGAHPALARVVARGDRAAAQEQPKAVVEPSFDHYRVVTQRNVFRPLVSPPQEHVALAVPSGIPSPTAPGTGPTRSNEPPRRSDPTADLAMTGVVESNLGLKALLRDVRTGASSYVSVGDMAFGLRVDAIEAKRVVLSRSGETYTVAMGAKAVPQAGATASSASGAPSGSAPSSGGQSSGSQGQGSGFGSRPGFGPGGMSREDMMRRFSQMSEEERSRFRESSGGGRGSGDGRGFGGGRGFSGRGSGRGD